MDQEFETGVVEVDLFPCELISFEIEKGSVSFSFDSNELTANILRMLQDKGITD